MAANHSRTKPWKGLYASTPLRFTCSRTIDFTACVPTMAYPQVMPEQYAATDSKTGLEVAVTGEFPPHHDDRIRIARTTTLFTRLMSTILSTENETERRERFHAIETQLEMADALIRQDMPEVQALMQKTLERMGITPQQMDEMTKKILDQLREGGADFPEFPQFPPPADDPKE